MCSNDRCLRWLHGLLNQTIVMIRTGIIFIISYYQTFLGLRLRALSICQNWPAGPVVLNVKWTISTRFSHKSAITLCNIYVLTDLTGQIWLITEFCPRIYQSGRLVLTNRKHFKSLIFSQDQTCGLSRKRALKKMRDYTKSEANFAQYRNID